MKTLILLVFIGLYSTIAFAQETTVCGACFGRGYVDIRPMSSSIAYSTAECGNCRQTYKVSQGHSHTCVYCRGTKQIAVAQDWSDDPYYMMAQEYAARMFGTGNYSKQNNNTGTSRSLQERSDQLNERLQKLEKMNESLSKGKDSKKAIMPRDKRTKTKKIKFLGRTITVLE